MCLTLGRHACGYALANKGQDTRALQVYLGHRNIEHTVRYTELKSTRSKIFGGTKDYPNELNIRAADVGFLGTKRTWRLHVSF
jgi:hypothetical protein